MVARINLSIPDNMRAAIDGVGDRINWSAIAQDAFRRALVMHKLSTEKGANMDNVIERLRLSEQDRAKEDHASGLAQGKVWAEKYASARDLRALAREDDQLSTNHVEWTLDIFTTVFPPDDDRNLEEFFEENDRGAVEEPSDETVAGFVEGALGVWREVEGKL